MKYCQVPLTWDNEKRKDGKFWVAGELLTKKEIDSCEIQNYEFLVDREINPQRTHTSFDARFSSDEEMSLSDLPSFNVRKYIASELAKIKLKDNIANTEEYIRALDAVYYGAITTYFHLLDRKNNVAIQAILDNALFVFSNMTGQDFRNHACRRVPVIIKSWFKAYTITRGDPLAAMVIVRNDFK